MSKNKLLIGIIALVVIGVAAWGLTGTVTKGLISKNDIALWYAAGTASQNFTRETSAGYDMTLQKLDWMGIDVCQVYGGGVNRTKAEIDAALTDVGTTNKRALWLSPGSWTITADADYSSYANVTWVIPPGASFSITAGKTLSISGPIQAGAYPIFSTTGTVTLTGAALAYNFAQWTIGAGSKGQGFVSPQDRGLARRPKFVYADASHIYIYPGVYHHNGTVEQMVYWDASTTYHFTGLASDDWSYLYIDDSAIVTAETNILTVSEFVDATTEPTYNEAKHGWYNGSDRCIFAVVTSGTPIWEFNHEDDFVLYGGWFNDVTSQDIDDVWEVTESALTIPKFTTKAQVTFQTTYSAAAPGVSYWRAEDVSGASVNKGHVITYTEDATDLQSYNTCIVICAASHYLELYHTNSNASHTSIFTDGFYFGKGM